MNTEITDNKKFEGWVLYDAECRFCVRLVRRFHNTLAGRRFELLPLQTPWVRAQLGLAETDLLAEMRLLESDGTVFGGADAVCQIARHFWWTWPFRQLSRIPAVMNLFRRCYRWIARHRSCANNVCTIKGAAVNPQGSLSDFLPLVILPLLVLAFRSQLAAWIFMWSMTFALYAGCKWLTFRLATRADKLPEARRALGYLLAWPGMNAAEFLNRKNNPPKPCRTEWLFAAAKVVFGFVLLYRATRLAWPDHLLIAGWIGMTGIIFILHFGIFHLLSLVWRQIGVKATPVMQNPLHAKSLTAFWGQHWNTAFNELAFRFIYRPLRRLVNPVAATVSIFGLSGLIHELVISLPAAGGYGLPTIYFLVQGLGIITERSRWGRILGLGRGVRGRIFTILISAGPAFWLFHPPFIKNVILPMLTAIGAN